MSNVTPLPRRDRRCSEGYRQAAESAGLSHRVIIAWQREVARLAAAGEEYAAILTAATDPTRQSFRHFREWVRNDARKASSMVARLERAGRGDDLRLLDRLEIVDLVERTRAAQVKLAACVAILERSEGRKRA